MNKYLISFAIASTLFLSSCVSLQSENTVTSDGRIKYDAVVDMSGMVAAMSTLSGTSSSDSTIPKDLCTDFATDSKSLAAWYENISCQSTGDYAARVKSELTASKNPGILIQSGVIVLNPFWTKTLQSSSVGVPDVTDNEDIMGITMKGNFHFPYPVVYLDAGTHLDADSVMINMMDKKILGRKDIFIIARADGKKPSIREVAQYKRQLRLQIQKAKRSGLYRDFSDFLNMK